MKRLAITTVIVALLGAIPIVWVERSCTAPRDPQAGKTAGLATERGPTRREVDSYLSFPAWHVVYAHDDLAGVLARGDESQFAYGRQITGFWRALCAMNRIAVSRGGAPIDTKLMLYPTGLGFTAEFAIKGAYEKTVGRLFEWVRGPRKTAEDEFVASDKKAFAEFLHTAPWYQYPFAWRLGAFWWQTRLRVTGLLRAVERRVVVTIGYGTKALAAVLIHSASVAALGAPSPDVQTVVVGLERRDVARDRRITVVDDLGGGRTLIQTPRSQAFTEVIVELARRGRDVAEIAGNQRILVTVLAPDQPFAPPRGATEVFEMPVQSRPDRRRIALDVAVPRLAAAIRALEQAGASIERIYDY